MVADPLILVRGVHIAATLLACGTTAFVVIVAEAGGREGSSRFRGISLPAHCADMARARSSDIVGHGLVGAVGVRHSRCIPFRCLSARRRLAGVIRYPLRLGVDCPTSSRSVARCLDPSATTRSLQLAAAAALIALPALVGHAGATPGMTGDVHLVSDMVHLLAAGAWLGGLPAFALLLARARAKPSWGDVAVSATRRFSVVGSLSVGGLLATGLVNSWFLLGGPRDLVTTDYGRLVALKIGLFSAMITLAAVNRFYLTPRLPDTSALRTLKRNSTAEIALGLCVVLFVAILGTLPPAAHVHPTPADIPPNAAFVHIHAPEAMADVTIDPGRAGTAEVTIRVAREDFSRFPAKDVRLALEPPTPGIQKLERDATAQTDGSWRVNGITLAEPGIWTVRVIVTPRKGEPIPLDAPIVIER